MYPKLLMLLCCALIQWGCAGLWAKPVTIHRVSALAPSKVVVYLSIKGQDQALTQLERSDFSIIEEELNLDAQEIGLRLKAKADFAESFTVLLIDLSGNLSESDFSLLESGLTKFSETVLSTQALSIYGFAGESQLLLIHKLTRKSQAPTQWGLKTLKPDAASRNLHGAIMAGTELLDAEFKKSQKSLRQGNLVIWSRGPDLAGRQSEASAAEMLKNKPYNSYFIRPEASQIDISSKVGRTGDLTYLSLSQSPLILLKVAQQIRDAWLRQYIISYCSPARSGERNLTIRVHYQTDKGHAKKHSSSASFDASQFGAGCEADPVVSLSSKKTPLRLKRRAVPQKKESGPAPDSNSLQEKVVAPPFHSGYE